jgi:hypothetical protein
MLEDINIQMEFFLKILTSKVVVLVPCFSKLFRENFIFSSFLKLNGLMNLRVF